MSKIGNNVNFIGRFTKDPEIRKAGETSVVNFSLARTRDFSKDKDVIYGKYILSFIYVIF